MRWCSELNGYIASSGDDVRQTTTDDCCYDDSRQGDVTSQSRLLPAAAAARCERHPTYISWVDWDRRPTDCPLTVQPGTDQHWPVVRGRRASELTSTWLWRLVAHWLCLCTLLCVCRRPPGPGLLCARSTYTSHRPRCLLAAALQSALTPTLGCMLLCVYVCIHGVHSRQIQRNTDKTYLYVNVHSGNPNPAILS